MTIQEPKKFEPLPALLRRVAAAHAAKLEREKQEQGLGSPGDRHDTSETVSEVCQITNKRVYESSP